jgi:hypothetical protein
LDGFGPCRCSHPVWKIANKLIGKKKFRRGLSKSNFLLENLSFSFGKNKLSLVIRSLFYFMADVKVGMAYFFFK